MMEPTSIAQKQAIINAIVLLDKAAEFRRRAEESWHGRSLLAPQQHERMAESCEKHARAELARAQAAKG